MSVLNEYINTVYRSLSAHLSSLPADSAESADVKHSFLLLGCLVLSALDFMVSRDIVSPNNIDRERFYVTLHRLKLPSFFFSRSLSLPLSTLLAFQLGAVDPFASAPRVSAELRAALRSSKGRLLLLWASPAVSTVAWTPGAGNAASPSAWRSPSPASPARRRRPRLPRSSPRPARPYFLFLFFLSHSSSQFSLFLPTFLDFLRHAPRGSVRVDVCPWSLRVLAPSPLLLLFDLLAFQQLREARRLRSLPLDPDFDWPALLRAPEAALLRALFAALRPDALYPKYPPFLDRIPVCLHFLARQLADGRFPAVPCAHELPDDPRADRSRGEPLRFCARSAGSPRNSLAFQLSPLAEAVLSRGGEWAARRAREARFEEAGRASFLSVAALREAVEALGDRLAKRALFASRGAQTRNALRVMLVSLLA